MKKLLFLFSILCFHSSFGQNTHSPDTVKVGVYINSIHDIDFRDKQYTISLWLWLKYKNPDFDFSKYLEVPMAKTVDKSFYTVDTLADGSIYMLMKLQCVMKDSWKIQNFPFDRQKLRFSIENSQYDSQSLVFAKDTLGKHYSKWTSSGWTIIPDSFKITTSIKKYEGLKNHIFEKVRTTFFSSFKVSERVRVSNIKSHFLSVNFLTFDSKLSILDLSQSPSIFNTKSILYSFPNKFFLTSAI